MIQPIRNVYKYEYINCHGILCHIFSFMMVYCVTYLFSIGEIIAINNKYTIIQFKGQVS